MTIDMKELYWLAGLIEGEGSFTFTNTPHGYPRVKVKMTDEDVVRRCQTVSGVGKVSGPHSNGDLKPSWTWVVQRHSHAAGLMMTLYTLMGERRQEKIRECLQRWEAEDNPGTGNGRRNRSGRWS
jgi:hypothetical protein